MESKKDVVVDLHHLLATSYVGVGALSRSAVSGVAMDAAKAATQALVNELFRLPLDRSDVGPIAALPHSSTALPRFKPVPKAKTETRWEAFAKTKGIEKKKKGRLEWDEAKEKWAPSWGYKRRGDEADEPIIEMKENDLMADPRAEREADRKQQVAINERKRKGNERRAAGGLKRKEPEDALSLSPAAEKQNNRKGGAGRSHTAGKKKEASVEVPTGVPVPSGVPVDLEKPGEKKRGKKNVDAALAAAQKSTASMGNFDALREGEKKQREKNKKRRFAPLLPKGGISEEVDHNLKLLADVLRPKAKAPKKGHAELMDTHDGEMPTDMKRKKGKFAGSSIGSKFTAKQRSAAASKSKNNKPRAQKN